MLAWYDAIVASVTEITAGTGGDAPARRGAAASPELAPPAGSRSVIRRRRSGVAAGRGGRRLRAEPRPDHLQRGGAAVRRDRDDRGDDRQRVAAAAEPIPMRSGGSRGEPAVLDAAIEESLRLEPAAAVVDRYATADTVLGGAQIARGDLVRLSISAANRDPACSPHPDRSTWPHELAPRGLRPGAARVRRRAPGAARGARGAGRAAGAAAGPPSGPGAAGGGARPGVPQAADTRRRVVSWVVGPPLRRLQPPRDDEANPDADQGEIACRCTSKASGPTGAVVPAIVAREADPRLQVPLHRMRDEGIDLDAAYELISSELLLDGQARLNLATFVTTWMPSIGGRADGRDGRQEHDRQGRVPADGGDRGALREHPRRPVELARARQRHRLLDDRLQRGGDAGRDGAEVALARADAGGRQADRPARTW